MSAVSSASSIAGRVLHLAAMFVDALQDVILQADLQLTKQQTVRSATDSLWALQDKVQGFFICHMINYTGYNQKWNVGQIRSAQWTVQRIKKIKNKIKIKLYKSEAGAELTRMVFSGNGIPGVSTLP